MKSVIILFLMAFFSSVYSQTADEIINKSIEAKGGKDKINAVKTIRISGKTGGNDFPFVLTIKRPTSVRSDLTIQGMTRSRAFDGTTAWQLNPFQGAKDPEKLPAEQARDMMHQAEFEGKLFNYKEKGSKAEFIGKDDFEGSDVYVIKLTEKEGEVTYFYIDADTYLILKEMTKSKVGEKEIRAETLYGNYKSIDGIMIPYSSETSGNVVTIDKVELNIPVEDSFFKMPVTTPVKSEK